TTHMDTAVCRRNLTSPENADFDTVADLYGQLVFVRELVERHVHVPARRSEFDNRITALERRANDPKVYLAVIGEFSAGKSTLIRMPLPKSSVEATTAAVTTIRSGPRFRVTVQFVDDAIVTGDDQNCSQIASKVRARKSTVSAAATLKEILDLLTSDPEVAAA